MIRHLLKLAWNRKRANALILVEIFFSFLVVFAVATLALYLWTNARQPLGFEADGVWHLAVDAGDVAEIESAGRRARTLARVLREAERLERVGAAAAALAVPYSGAHWGRSAAAAGGGARVSVDFNEVTDDFAEVFDLEVVAGRWFGPADEAFPWHPVVLDRQAARALFGGEDPLGRWLDTDPDEPRQRVVGVISEFRQHGELAGPQPYLFERERLGPGTLPPVPRDLVLEMVPGTGAEYEQAILERLQRVAPEWTFTVRPLSVLRGTSLRLRLVPLAAVAVIAVFLMLMVGLGLTGVLWQHVVQRTREIGLRRAAGASRGSVHRQLVAELLLVATMALALGTALVVQLPILDLVGALSPGVFTAGLATALAIIYLLTVACALYPSWMAGRVQPAEALRWE